MKTLFLTFFTSLLVVLSSITIAAQSTKHGSPVLLTYHDQPIRQELTFNGKQQAVRVTKIEKGRSYTVWANTDKECLPTVSLADGSQVGSTFSFIASADYVNLIMTKAEGGSECQDKAVWLSFAPTKEKGKKSNVLEKMSNLAVAGGQSAQSLVQDVFIGGGCFDVTGASGIGSSSGRGVFSNGGGSILLDQGVILSTGSITNAPGPNNSNSAGNSTGGGSDPDLAAIASGAVHDATGIEFDFQPTISTINFLYVFASEEYCEYVGSSFNDVFGFFISGPGISGGFSFNGQNIAVLPGSGLYVGINSVNHNLNSGYFVPNQGNCGGSTNMAEIQFDGWTTILSAVANVIPCETYHIRLVIGDVGDSIYDSAVFLGANSFSAGGTASGEAFAVSSGSNIVYEPCNDGSFIFTRAGGDLNMPLVVSYTILPMSTATPGLDYVPIPTTIVIPPGATEYILPVTVFDDGIPEGVETIVLSLTNSCSCSSFEIELQIHDAPDLEVSLPDIEECAGVPISISATASGGVPNSNLTYQWSNGMSGPSIFVTPITSTSYTVTVTNACGQTATTSNNVEISVAPTAILTGSATLCATDPEAFAELTVTLTGDPPWNLVYSINGTPQPAVVVTESPYFIHTNISGIYALESVSSVIGNCTGVAGGVAPIIVSSVEVSATTTPSTCLGSGTMTATPIGGTEPYFYAWSNGFPSFPTAIGLNQGTYTVTVTDLFGCTGTTSATVTQAPPMTASANSPTGVNCANPNGGSINLQVSNGEQPLTFNWTGGVGNVQNPTGLAAGIYNVTVVDSYGCTATASAFVDADIVPPLAVSSTEDLLTCNNAAVDLIGSGSSTGSNISYLWSGPDVVGNDNTINSQAGEPGLYTLLVTNTDNGCTAEAPLLIGADTDLPTAVASGSELNCLITETLIDGNGSSLGMNYQWNGPGIVSGENTLTPIVNQGGTYTLTVADPDNGCTATATTTVTSNTTDPTATIANPALLTCAITDITLDGSGSSQGPNFSYQWFFENALLPGATEAMLNAQVPGNYQIMVTDVSNGCVSDFSVLVEQNLSAPAVTASTNGEITCMLSYADVIAEVDGDPSDYSYSWSTLDGVITSGDKAKTAIVSAPGTYTVVVTNIANGCTNTAEVLVSQDASIPTVEITASDNLDCLVTQVELNASGSSQGATLTYTWTTQGGNFVSGQNTLTPVVDAPGIYTLTIFDSSNSCESDNSISITLDDATPEAGISPAPVLDCEVLYTILEGNVSNLPLEDLNFSWTSPDGQIDGSSNILTPVVSHPGVYTLLVTNSLNGCTDEATITIEQDIEQPEALITNPATLTCSTISIILNGSNSSTGVGFDYLWTASGGNISGAVNTLTAVVEEPGIYTLLVTNTVNGCTNTAQVEVEQDIAPPSADAGLPAILTCTNTEFTLNGSGSTGSQFAYSWTGPGILSGANTLSPEVNSPGLYQLLVTNLDNDCTQTASVDIAQDIATPVAEAGVGGILSCFETQLSLNAAGSSAGDDFQYEWTSAGGNIVSGEGSLSPVVNAPGIYDLLVTNTINGCTATDAVEVLQDDDLPEVSAGSAGPITCLVTEITLDGSGSVVGPEFTYQWSTTNGNILTGANSLNPTVDAPGIYVLTVTNTATNCTNLASVTVQAQTTPPAVEAGEADQLTCVELSATLNGGGSATGSNYIYQWTTLNGNILNGETTLTPEINQPGTYQLLVTNTITGCTSTDQVVVQQSLDSPVAVASTPGALTCALTSLSLNGAGSSAGGDFNYLWSTMDGNIVSGATSISPVVNQPGSYLLLVTNQINGCTETATVNVAQDIQNPTAEAGTANLLTCTVLSLNLSGAGSSSGAGFSYLWSTQNGNILTGGTTLTPTINQTGTYLLTVTNTGNGCTAEDYIVVSQDVEEPQAIITPPGQLNCLVSSLNINASASQGIEFQYGWTTTGGNILAGANTLEPLIDAPGDYLLTVTNLINGCTKQIQTTVAQDIVKPVANAGNAFVMDCFEEVNHLDGSGSTGNGPISFSWTTPNGSLVSGSNTANPGIAKPGLYLLTVANLQNGCTASDQVIITRDEPTVEPFVIQPLCYGDKGTISLSGTTNGSPPYLSSIDGGYSFSSQNTFTKLPAGTYSVIVQDAKGCEFATSAVIEEPNQLTVKVGDPMATIKSGQSYQINTQISLPLDEIKKISWFPSTDLSCDDCLNPIASPPTTTLYKVDVVTKNDCRDDATILLRVDRRVDIYVPNAFSPNGDGTNDIFMIFSDQKNVEKIKSFLVFNRWGETVFEYYNFEPNNPAYGWDGKHRGEFMNPAVFTWFAIVEFKDGQEKLFKGSVNLLR